MSDALPTRDGLYVDREDMVWRLDGIRLRCIQAPGEGYDLTEPKQRDELAHWAPYAPLVAFTSEERTHLVGWAQHREKVDRAFALYEQAQAAAQVEIARRLISADLWRSIRAKVAPE